MINIPGSVPPPIVPPTAAKKGDDIGDVKKDIAPSRSSVSREPYALDSQGMAVRMAALSMDAKEKELSFEDIVAKVIKETGLLEPQSAMEEANRKLQKEIDAELEKIKSSKELMEEAQSWQELADLLENKMSQEQVQSFIGMLESEIKGTK